MPAIIMRNLNLIRSFGLAVCCIVLAHPALAEKADRDRAVNLEADTVTLDDARKISVYAGNVILSQGTLMLRADRVQVTQSNAGLASFSAVGRPVAFRQKPDGSNDYLEGFADRIEYNSEQAQLELIGQARLRRGADELRGARISYNANTSFYKVVGQPDATTPSGRVRAVIRPKPRSDKLIAP
ncbi:MAG: lipopolysaccharide transport periplasmic protein LptA [Thiobacillus sp.]